MRSMTGFGGGRAENADFVVQVEIRSVNNRFCDVTFRGPREFASLEPSLVRQVKDRFARGRIDLTVRLEPKGQNSNVVVDSKLAASYVAGLTELAQSLGDTGNAIALEWIAGLPGVIRTEELPLDAGLREQGLSDALKSAMDGLEQMRESEGGALMADLQAHIEALEALRQRVVEQVGDVVSRYRAKLEARLETLQADGLEPQRLAQEIVVFADRADISEEVARLGAHLGQYRALLKDEGPVGRRMEFLAQEIHREVNTIGSKSQEAELSTLVVEMKGVVERIREQAANVE